MISLQDISLDFGGEKVLDQLSLEVAPGEFMLLAGATGSGKSSLLGILAGLVPAYTGGRLQGTVRLRARRPAGAPVISLVQQQPSQAFVAESVAEEVMFGLQWLPTAVQLQRAEAALDLVGSAQLRDRRIDTLSAGEAQRVAIAAAIAHEPELLLLDEPTSALDPVAADEVLSLLRRLSWDLGITVLIAEHRFDHAVQHVDRIAVLNNSRCQVGQPREMLLELPAPPAVAQIAHALGWQPLPLAPRELVRKSPSSPKSVVTTTAASGKPAVLELKRLTVLREAAEVLREVNLQVSPGQVCAVLGRNGAGKSTLLQTAFGDFRPSRGSVRINGEDPSDLPAVELLRMVALLPQQPQDLLIEASVALECSANDRRRQLPAGTTAARLAELVPDVAPSRHPRELSEGQRTLVALGLCTSHRPRVLLLDEPTRGLDQSIRQRVGNVVRELAEAGTAVVIATHDVDWIAEVADCAVRLLEGELLQTGSAREVLTSNLLTAPTATKICWPSPVLTVAEAVAEFQRAGA